MTDCIINWLYKIDSGSDRFNCFALEVRFRSAVILFHSCQELLWQITLLKWKYRNNQPACESPASTTGTYGTGQIFDRLTRLGVSTLTMRKFRRLAVQSFVKAERKDWPAVCERNIRSNSSKAVWTSPQNTPPRFQYKFNIVLVNAFSYATCNYLTLKEKGYRNSASGYVSAMWTIITNHLSNLSVYLRYINISGKTCLMILKY